MHAFDFTLFVWIFWIAVILLILSALGLVFLGPNIQGAVANWLCWLLAIVAARLARALRSNDVVGRMGGDEFACLLRDIREPGQLSRLACKVHETVAAPIKIGDLIISVRPSIGVSMFPQGGLSSDALLKSADEAMYRAKREQTGHAFFEGPARVMP